MTRQHFEFMADWIARNATRATVDDLMALATTTGSYFNAQFDPARFAARVVALRESYGGYRA